MKMNEKKDMNINLFDLKFLIDRASSYVYNLKNERYSMKLWEDRIEEIKLKFDELIRGKGESYETYAYELGYVKDVLINIYQKHPKVTFSKALNMEPTVQQIIQYIFAEESQPDMRISYKRDRGSYRIFVS